MGDAVTVKSIGVPDHIYNYLLEHGVREHPTLAALRRETARHPMVMMQISPEQGALMAMLVQLIGARRCIEVGVFTGYSSLAVALALPEDGRILACDVSEEFTRVAQRYWQDANVAHKIDLHLRPARETLESRIAAGEAGQYDFAFIDADKESYEVYYEQCLTLLRSGGLILVDNVLWSGDVADPAASSPSTAALKAFNEARRTDSRVDLVMLPVADGLSLLRKR